MSGSLHFVKKEMLQIGTLPAVRAPMHPEETA